MCPKNIRNLEIKRVLFIGLSSLGDNLLLTPSIKIVRDSFRGAVFDIVVGPRAVEFAKGHPWFSEFVVLEKDRIVPVLLRLRQTRYDLIVDFRNSLIPFVLRGHYKLQFFLREFLSEKFFTHESERMLRFLEPWFGVPPEVRLYFPVTTPERERTDRFLRSLGLRRSHVLVAVHPGAGFPGKRWAAEKFADAARHLVQEYDARILVVGGEGERDLAHEVCARMGEKESINLAGRLTLRELAALFEKVDMLITNDTGPMHLACAVGCPVVAVFGPGNPYRYGPIGTRNHVVHSGEDCFPCRVEHRCRRNFICMERISVEQVVSAARLVLDEGKQLHLFDL